MSADAYQSVEAIWAAAGGDKIPSGPEAIRGARLLIREAARFAGLPKPKRLKLKLTSGNRQTWPHSGVWMINPHERHGHGGWAEIVHSISHWAFRRRAQRSGLSRREAPSHDPGHVAHERNLARYAVEHGFLDGRLSRPEKAKPTLDDLRAKRRAHAEAKLKALQTRIKRLETQCAKWRKTVRYYERAAQPS
jgi:hypothetical protein